MARPPKRSKSPGGTEYEQDRSGPAKRRRTGAGFDNPSHDHSNMTPLWRAAAVSPIPFASGTPAEKNHLMDPARHFNTLDSSGQPTRVKIQGHSNGVLGHSEDASAYWNRVGHTQLRSDNMLHNRQTSTYHGIEEKGASAASGSSVAGYRSPSPSRSHRSHWDSNDPNFKPGHFHPFHAIPPTVGSPSASGQPIVRPVAMRPQAAGAAMVLPAVATPASATAARIPPLSSAPANSTFGGHNLRARPVLPAVATLARPAAVAPAPPPSSAPAKSAFGGYNLRPRPPP